MIPPSRTRSPSLALVGTVTYTPSDYMGQPIGESVTVHEHDGSVEDASSVPDGTVAQVLEWVGYDPDRAKAALVSEHAKREPRKTLIDAVEGIVTKENG